MGMRAVRKVVCSAAAAALLCTAVAACGSSGSKPGSGALVPASSQDVSFDAGGTTTYGTLAIPAHRNGQRLAARCCWPAAGRPTATAISRART
ncbi:MAG TPA: hypothetical protein VGM10_35900 [Actinocrinis sp.]